MTSSSTRLAARLIRGRTFSTAATVVRQAAGTRDAPERPGVWRPGPDTTEEVRVVSQPLRAAEEAEFRDVAPEGARYRDTRRFWLDRDVRALRVGAAQTDGDRIAWGGEVYRVLRAEPWGGYWRIIGVREET